jgi:hypothetical protein
MRDVFMHAFARCKPVGKKAQRWIIAGKNEIKCLRVAPLESLYRKIKLSGEHNK